MQKDNLFIKKITIDQGPTLKRWMPRAHGRATMIRKKSSHIILVLEEKVPSQGKKKAKAKVAAPVMVEDLKSLPKEEKGVKVAAESESAEIKEEQERENKEELVDVRRLGKHRNQQHQDKKGMKKGKIKKVVI